MRSTAGAGKPPFFVELRGKRDDPEQNHSNRIENVDVDRELRADKVIGYVSLKAGYREAPHLSRACIKTYELAVCPCGAARAHAKYRPPASRIGVVPSF